MHITRHAVVKHVYSVYLQCACNVPANVLAGPVTASYKAKAKMSARMIGRARVKVESHEESIAARSAVQCPGASSETRSIRPKEDS